MFAFILFDILKESNKWLAVKALEGGTWKRKQRAAQFHDL